MSKIVRSQLSIEHAERSLSLVSDQAQKPRWRPLSLRRVSLAITIAISTSLLGLVILSHYQEYKHGAVLVAKDASGLSDGQIFLFKYLPTILIVLFGVWISAIDLDIKRLEPFYQLSQRGKQIHPPLLCSYDTDFVLEVLLRSIRRRDFIVLGATVLLIITTIVIPAVQNSMLLPRSQILTEIIQVTQKAALVSTDTQVKRMSHNVMATAYSMCWLGQLNPTYTTRNSSFAPFMHYLGPENIIAASLEVPTTRYWTELNCWKPASIHITANSTQTFAKQGFTVSFADGRGCNTSDLLLVDNSVSYDYAADYEAYYFAASSQGFASPGRSIGQACPQFPHLFLAVYRVRGSDFLRIPDFGVNGNATAMFCEPQYYSEPVTATVAANNYSILSYSATGNRIQLLDDVLNRTHFEDLLALGNPPLIAGEGDLDVGDSFPIIQTTRLKNASVATPAAYSQPNMIGYLLGASKFASSQYLDYDTLQKGYAEAYQLLFALAMSQNFDKVPHLRQDARLQKTREVVALVPGFAIATEALFILGISACVYLFAMVPARKLLIVKDPDSLAETMLLTRNKSTQEAFEDLTTLTNHGLKKTISAKTFVLNGDGKTRSFLECSTEMSSSPLLGNECPSAETSDSHIERYPIEMSWTVSGTIILSLVASIFACGLLRSLSVRENGLRLPSKYEIVNQLLLNFLPTIFASGLGVYFSLLCRTLSFLKPLERLRRGNAIVSNTLQASYNSLPAPLVFTTAWKGRYYVLAAFSIAAVLSNVLTVTLAGIFLRMDVTSSKTTAIHSLYKPSVIQAVSLDDVTSSSTLDSVYPVIANSTGTTDLPTWTTREYGHLPISFGNDLSNFPVASEFEYTSIGYGADFECINLLTPSANSTSLLQFDDQGKNFSLTTNFTTSGGATCQCSFNFDESLDNELERGNGFAMIGGSLSHELSSLEIAKIYTNPLQAPTNEDVGNRLQDQCDFCDRRVVYGWVRGHLVPTSGGGTNLTATGKFKYNATIMACTPRMKSQKMSLRITRDGHVLSSQGLESPNYSFDPSVNLTASFNTSINAIWNSVGVANRTWHTDIIARDMANYIFKKTQNDTGSLLDPQVPPPSFETASAFVSDTFARIFATQLFIDRSYLQTVNSPSHVIRDYSITHNTRQASSTFDTVSDSSEIQGTMFFKTKRVFVSLPMFIISISILAFDLIILLIFRLTLPAPFLPRMPFTIASQIALFAGSRAVDDVVGVNGDLKKLDEKGYRYGFGRYVSKTGTVCIGIEREGFVTKLRPDEGVRKTKGGERQTDWKNVFRRRKIGDRRSYEDIDGQEFDILRRG